MKEIGIGLDPNRLFITNEKEIIRTIPDTNVKGWLDLNRTIFKIFKHETIDLIYNFITNDSSVVINRSRISMHLPVISTKNYNLYAVKKIETITRPHEWTRNQIKEVLLHLAHLQKFVNSLSIDDLIGRSYSKTISKLRSSTECFINSFLDKSALKYYHVDIEEIEKECRCLYKNEFLSKFFNFTEHEISELKNRGLKNELIKIFDDCLYTNDKTINLIDCGFKNVTFEFNEPIFLDIGSFSNHESCKKSLIEQIVFSLETIDLSDFDTPREYLYNCDDFNHDRFIDLVTSIKIDDNATKSRLEKRSDHKNENNKDNATNFYIETNDNKQWDCYRSHESREMESKMLSNKIKELGWSLGKIVDIGGNDGSLTDSLDSHWDTRVLIDSNEKAIDRSRDRPNACKTTTARLDIIKKVKDCSIDFHFNSDWYTRLSGDTSFLSSITHHIIRLGGNVELIAKLCNMGKKYCIIEMISHKEPQISSWYNSNINVIIDLLCLIDDNWSIISTLENYDDEEKHRKNRTYYFIERKCL